MIFKHCLLKLIQSPVILNRNINKILSFEYLTIYQSSVLIYSKYLKLSTIKTFEYKLNVSKYIRMYLLFFILNDYYLRDVNVYLFIYDIYFLNIYLTN